MIKLTTRNIFDSDKDVLVCPVNCYGVMGKGLALQFKRFYPEMFLKYKDICQSGLLIPGKLWLWKGNGQSKDVLCFPTKVAWWMPSNEEYIVTGLEKFVNTYKSVLFVDSLSISRLLCRYMERNDQVKGRRSSSLYRCFKLS